MTSLRAEILEAAPRNHELLAILAKNDHAISDVQQHDRYISDLESQLKAIQGRVATLDRKREQEFQDHKKYRDSVLRRFAYKASGNNVTFEARAAKEEREYHEALQEEHLAKEEEAHVQSLRDPH
jgi:TolA-binding protein